MSVRRIDEYYMSRALSLAFRGQGETSPNPMVGCVIVRDGRVIGEGHHARCGAGHAETICPSLQLSLRNWSINQTGSSAAVCSCWASRGFCVFR